MKINEIKGSFENVSETKDGFKADCPICDKGNGKKHLSLRQGVKKIDLKCFKDNCDGRDVLAAVGLELKDLYENTSTTQKPKKEISKVYDYLDADGKLIYQAVRYMPKDFRQRRPDGKGGLIYDLKGVTLVPYQLPSLIANRVDPNTVFICEGEKDCENLIKQGLIASCNPMGAGKWKKDFNQYFADFPVVIIADKDEVGRKHANQVAHELASFAKTVKVIEMPDVGDYKVKDVSDWLSCGGTKDELIILAENYPERETEPVAPASDDDLGNTCKVKQAVEAYYDVPKKEYLIKNDRGIWLHLNEGQFKKTLQSLGYDSNTYDASGLSEVDQVLIELRNKKDVVYAGRVAGLMAGFYPQDRILVTESPRIIESNAGDWPKLKQFFHGLLHEDGLDQETYFFGWLKISYEALKSGRKIPAQALVVCGKKDCGKSLLQKIVTEILGGRYAKPHQYMMGGTSFNSELFGAEHLMLEDEITCTEIRKRRDFGSKIKDITVNEAQRCHAKGREALSLKPFWRLTITLNDEPEALMILPPMDDSLEDKMIILRAHRSGMTMPTNTPEERELFWKTLTDELPAFLDYLVRMTIPDELKSQRFGITHFHHPEILKEIHRLSPESTLHILINQVIDAPWQGTAEELEKKLTNHPETQYAARRILSWANACGTYLGRLAKGNPDSIIKARHHGEQRMWTIMPSIKVKRQFGMVPTRPLDDFLLDDLYDDGTPSLTFTRSSQDGDQAA